MFLTYPSSMMIEQAHETQFFLQPNSQSHIFICDYNFVYHDYFLSQSVATLQLSASKPVSDASGDATAIDVGVQC